MSEKLDLAQLIAKAMNSNSNPEMPDAGEFDSKTDTKLGDVPQHLRGIFCLLHDLGKEAAAAAEVFREVQERHAVVHKVFYESVKDHLPNRGKDFDGVKMCPDWQVAGYKEDQQKSVLDSLLGAMFGARH